jgi:hypothetical protein
MVDGRWIVEELDLIVQDGEVGGGGSWVYVWALDGEVLYVGATRLPPAVRTWLHLHDDDPEVGRIRAEHPEAAGGTVEIRAFRLSDDVARGAVRDAVRRGLDGGEPLGDTEAAEVAATEILRRLGRG